METLMSTLRVALRWLIVATVLAILYGISGMTRTLGIQPVVRACPKQTLSELEVEALYQDGHERMNRARSGEYRMLSSIEDGLPRLKRAALHGHREAMATYGGLFLQTGGIERMSLDGLSFPDATAEGMMWSILGVHLGAEVMDGDQEAYRVLLDPEVPFPDAFFEEPSGTAWLFQMLSEPGLDWARQQAFAWRACWPM